MKKNIKNAEKTNTIVLDIEQKQLKVKVLNVIIFTILIILVCICAAPLLWLLVSAFKDTKEFIMNPPTIIPKRFQPYKLIEVWKKA